MSGPATRYFDDGDQGELLELLAIITDLMGQAERSEMFGVYCCLADYQAEAERRLTELMAVRAANGGAPLL